MKDEGQIYVLHFPDRSHYIGWASNVKNRFFNGEDRQLPAGIKDAKLVYVCPGSFADRDKMRDTMRLSTICLLC